jgi:nitrate reductase NapAB chaperone NapD
MPVISAVVHLSAEPAVREQTLRALASLPGLELGEVLHQCVPVVLDTDSRCADRALWDAIQDAPGVQHVDLVFADFQDLLPPPPDVDAGTGGAP